MIITVTKRIEIEGKVIESTVSASTNEQDHADVMRDVDERPYPTDSEEAATMADALFQSINRDQRTRIIKDEAGNEVIIS